MKIATIDMLNKLEKRVKALEEAGSPKPEETPKAKKEKRTFKP